MNDPYLDALVDSVEKGGDPIAITLALTSGAVVSGALRHSRHFVEISPAVGSTSPSWRTIGARKRSEQRREVALTEAYKRIEGSNGDRSEADAITLSEVRMVWSNGDGIQVPGARIATDAIAAWWLAPGTAFKGPKDSGGFVGVAIPLG